MLMMSCRCGPRPRGAFVVTDAIRAGARLDPTGTHDIRNKFRREMDAAWSKLYRLVLHAVDRNDALGLAGKASKEEFAKSVLAAPSLGFDKVKSFQDWLDAALDQVVLVGGQWTSKYIQEAADRALERADELSGGDGSVDSARVRALVSLTVVELQGVMEAVSQQAVRAFTDGLMAKQRPSQVARSVAAVVNSIGKIRGRMIVNTMIVKTFSAATLDAFRAAGITHVGVKAERIVQGSHGKTRAKDSGFDPTQPRDDHGQWTSVGAGTSEEHIVTHAGQKIKPSREAPENKPFFSEFHNRYYMWGYGWIKTKQAWSGQAGLHNFKPKQRVGDAARKTSQARGPGGQFRPYTKMPSAKKIRELLKAEAEREVAKSSMVEVLTAGDDDVCQICEDISDDGPYLLDEAEGLVPAHPNAVLEGSSIASYGAMHEMVRARFSGPAINLRTSSKVLTIGPNHPMLTRRGFVKARDLHEGDELLYDLRADCSAVRAGSSDLEQVPLVEDAFGAMFAAGHGSRVAASHLDLHGDAVFCEREVEVVHPVRPLLPVLDALGIEHLCKSDLVRSDIALRFEALLRAIEERGSAVLHAAHSIVCRAHLSGALAVAHARPFDLFLFAAGSEDYSGLQQQAGHDSSAAFEGRGYREDAISRSVGFKNGVYRWDRVLEVHAVEFSGMAFDASTATGLYNSDGYVVKNCRCAFVPASDERFAEVQKDSIEDAPAIDAADSPDQ